MSMNIALIIFGMAIVTYIPRVLPLITMNGKEMPPKVKAILQNVPYAALGALIFPGILFIQGDIWFGVIGGITALIIALIGANLIVVVASAITALTIYSFFI
ncbi:branched-chain amino acid transporter [Anaerobacillus alkalidiazotrophicus]|uniref:Branched-chain amino acid transporter n=1 Tax=Anaerobacillus alkalidiazotrophicus TaxID=472963 RepID=A0A1S2M8D3_9BACI|nr:AzlD domain-containing protein [Anaerobacillus alkalidiazotrophicus]OIJ18446.1 branched-chain amino acid transporter [Anaerobacillus alkalidiazotrophicus]OIJ19925.1 branched-chain amino acid transporter [Anaerobacillus alkalidiazotrophicus]